MKNIIVVKPFGKGFVGISKAGTIYGVNRVEVTNHIIKITYATK